MTNIKIHYCISKYWANITQIKHGIYNRSRKDVL